MTKPEVEKSWKTAVEATRDVVSTAERSMASYPLWDPDEPDYPPIGTQFDECYDLYDQHGHVAAIIATILCGPRGNEGKKA